MMKINNYNDLIAEKRTLESSLALHKVAIQHSIQEVKDRLKPISKVVTFAEKAVTREATNPLLSAGVNIASDLILKRVILARAGWVTQLVLPYVLKNYSSHFLGGKNGVKQKALVNGAEVKIPVRSRPAATNFFHRLGDKLKSN